MVPASFKNRDREPPTFANINLLGRCNANCYFCLGKDIEAELRGQDQTQVHFSEWLNFEVFLDRCRATGIRKLYITGQNTDALLYTHLGVLIDYLQDEAGFDVGLRTNGFLAHQRWSEINQCRLETGYTLLSLRPATLRAITERSKILDWHSILTETLRPRVQIVITRHNVDEFEDLIALVSLHPRVQYVQVRRISTDTRISQLQPDIDAYERLYTATAKRYPLNRRLWEDAEEYLIFGVPVVFWRTVRTSINSYNYFTDGTISDEYFIVEGYLKNRKG